MPDIEEVSADTAIGKFKVSGTNVNNLLTVLGFVGICILILMTWNHSALAMDARRDLVNAIREMSEATREQNCLLRFEQKDRQGNADFCKRLSK